MSNIVTIVSSPRPESNSGAIANAILDGAMGLSTNIIKYYNLNSARNFSGCDACGECKKNGACAIHDGLTEVLKDLVSADIIIFSTPVYFNGPSSQFKTLLDRMYSFVVKGDENPIRGKKTILILTGAAPVEAISKVADDLRSVLVSAGFDVGEPIAYSTQGDSRHVTDDMEFLDKMRSIGLDFRNT